MIHVIYLQHCIGLYFIYVCVNKLNLFKHSVHIVAKIKFKDFYVYSLFFILYVCIYINIYRCYFLYLYPYVFIFYTYLYLYIFVLLNLTIELPRLKHVALKESNEKDEIRNRQV